MEEKEEEEAEEEVHENANKHHQSDDKNHVYLPQSLKIIWEVFYYQNMSEKMMKMKM
jgi:hypothetical protein